jgi:peptide/nickel transport system substrate-binding protein
MRRKGRIAALLTVACLLAVSCDPGEGVDIEEDPAEAEAAGAGAEAPEGQVLVAAIGGEPDQLDPHLTSAYPSFQVLENVYDTLVQPGDPATETEPALATDWEVSEDELTWTFELRDDVVWHNGREFTADDVVYSLERIAEEGLNAVRLASVDEVVAVDDHTVELELSHPTPNLLEQVGGFKGMAIVPEEIVEDGSVELEPVGTGPFRFVSYDEGQQIVLEANEDYWGDGPFIEGVEFRFIPEGTVAMTNLRAGQVDWTDNVPPQDFERMMESDEVVAETAPSGDFWYIAFNFAVEPFDDVDVRRALSFGLSREQVAEAAWFGFADPTQTAIPDANEWHTDYAPFEYDPARAQQLLDDAGVDDLAVDFMVTNEYEETIQAAQVVASQWNDLGVTTSIRIEDFSGWLDDQAEGNYDALLLGWLGNVDPYDFYHLQHVSDGEFNTHGYENEEVDELLQDAAEETDEDQRQELYDEAVELIVGEVSYLYLYNPEILHAWQPEVSGYEVLESAAIRFENVELDR